MWKGGHCHPHNVRQGQKRRWQEMESEKALLYQPFALAAILQVPKSREFKTKQKIAGFSTLPWYSIEKPRCSKR